MGKCINIDEGWEFGHGLYGGLALLYGDNKLRSVDLPHDYMIESDVREDAPAGAASGFYTEGTAFYTRTINIPADWEGENIVLKFDGVMMNATLDINGCKAALWHYGYVPMHVDITPYVYFGKENRITLTVNPSMQPNSRWYTGAGIFRSAYLIHEPRLHVGVDGIFAYTEDIEYAKDGSPKTAYIKTEITIENRTPDNKMALVEVFITEDGSDEVLVLRKAKIQINQGTDEVAYIPLSMDAPKLWSADSPFLYRVHASVTDIGHYITHHIEKENGTTDSDDALFGVRTVTADVRNGLRINGKTVKLKGGCLHHDNGVLGAVSLYDSEYRKLKRLKEIGFNAVRTTHNPPSAAFIEACDRIGMYVFDEAFDAWGIMKVPGDYNMFFEHDWERDLSLFIKRDRVHPSVIIWSTGNEIPERGGLGNGYTLATKLARKVKELDISRPVCNAVCSFWSGLDDELSMENARKVQKLMDEGGIQNIDPGKEDISWEIYSEAFTNGLDIVGYNYLEDKYERDHELYPERIILGSENFPKEIGKRWPLVMSKPYVLGDFTWTAFDYIGEAGIGKSIFVPDDEEERKKAGASLMSHSSQFPYRLANDADVDINGHILPQGYYRRIVWGADETKVFSYDPANYGKIEILSMWGFTDARDSWNYKGYENQPISLVVFSRAEEVELFVNKKSIGRKKQGEALAVEGLPYSFMFDTVYEPGEVVAVSYTGGKEVSRDSLHTTGTVSEIKLLPERKEMSADGHSLAYIEVVLVDKDGNVVQDSDMKLSVNAVGEGILMGFGSAIPITDENYTKGEFTTYRGRALAVIRSGYKAGEVSITASCKGMEAAETTVKLN